jgi:hypothetical protein
MTEPKDEEIVKDLQDNAERDAATSKEWDAATPDVQDEREEEPKA